MTFLPSSASDGVEERARKAVVNWAEAVETSKIAPIVAHHPARHRHPRVRRSPIQSTGHCVDASGNGRKLVRNELRRSGSLTVAGGRRLL